jgi:hypothetical protein
MRQQLVLNLVERASDDSTTRVWQALNIQQRAEALAVLGRLIARAAASAEAIVVSKDSSDE